MLNTMYFTYLVMLVCRLRSRCSRNDRLTENKAEEFKIKGGV